MRPPTYLCFAFLLVVVVPTLQAQLLEPSIQIGLRVPTSGELVVPVPIPTSAGFSVVRRSFTETSGLAVTGALRFRLTESFGLTAGVTASLSERVAEQSNIVRCASCPVTMVSGLAALSARRVVGPRTHVELGVGGELIHLGGEAYSEPLSGLNIVGVEPSRRVVGGAMASMGAARTLRRGGTVRADARIRQYRITSRWTDPGLESLYGAISSTPYSDVVMTLGWSPR